MNEKLILYKDKILEFWRNRTTVQKIVMVGSVISLLLLFIIISTVASKPHLVPLYSNLSLQETGQIQATLQERGIQYEVTNNGTTINVPEAVVDTLMVELAAEGIPDSGNIDYSFFGQNSGWGITDKEFNVLKLDAMQTELANLIKGIDGVQDAKVMINLPEESIWVGQENGEASASIVLNQKPGYTFDQQQINGLFHLVSKSIPNLPMDNIVITNQMFESFTLKNNDENGFDVGETFTTNQQIKEEIENDIQSQVQQMLGAMIGRDKVVVSVTADLDFTKEKRTEERYEPADTENMEGITRSAEKITETFSGNGQVPGGVEGTGDTDIPNMAEVESTTGDYERVEERINKEVDKIYKEIVESPYEIKDLGIQVVVDPTTGTTTGENGQIEPVLLDEQQQEVLRTNIEEMLGGIIRTSISSNENIENVNEKISITMQPFNGRPTFNEPKSSIPPWIYAATGALLLIVIGLLILILRRNRKTKEVEVEEIVEAIDQVPDVNEDHETEGGQRRKQLERMAKEKPDEFAKLLRTWLAED